MLNCTLFYQLNFIVYISKNDCLWFDSQNARLIILCATLGIFGVHKFAQHKNFQGFIYVLLDLTIVGIVLTVILSWFDLIFLTAKSDNRPGNMMLGVMFILLESLVLIPGSSGVVIKNINPLFVESKDSVVSVESSVCGAKESVVPEDEDKDDTASEDELVNAKTVTVTIDDGTVPVITTENGKFPAQITVNEDTLVLVAEPKDDSATKTSVSEEKEFKTKSVPVVKKAIESTDVEAPKKITKAQNKEIKKVEAPALDENKNNDDDFGSFSLYNMITGA